MSDRVLIATPSAKTVEERYAFSLFGLAKYETAKGHDVDLTIERGPYIHHNRNKFVREFLAGNWQWLLQIDMDILFQCDVLEKLLARKKDVVFGMYVRLNNGRGLFNPFRLETTRFFFSLPAFFCGVFFLVKILGLFGMAFFPGPTPDTLGCLPRTPYIPPA